jgi:hypothetical protein
MKIFSVQKITKIDPLYHLRSSLLNLWLIAGLYVDGWSHEHGKPLVTFFTPWHAFFYAGFFAVTLFLLYPTLINFFRYKQLKIFYPAHYLTAIIGLIIFGLGGIGDVIWHGFYGFEKQIDAILSPTHLGLYVGMFLIFIAPFNALRHQKHISTSLNNTISLVLFATIIFSFFSFLTQYANPLISPFAFSTHKTGINYYGQTIGLVSLFIHITFLIMPLLLVINRYKLPVGSLTFIFTVNAIGMTAIHDHFDYIISAFLAGTISDLIFLKLLAKKRYFHLVFSIFIPIIYATFYFLIGYYTRGIWWSGYLVLGAIALTGFLGFSLYLFSLASRK